MLFFPMSALRAGRKEIRGATRVSQKLISTRDICARGVLKIPLKDNDMRVADPKHILMDL